MREALSLAALYLVLGAAIALNVAGLVWVAWSALR